MRGMGIRLVYKKTDVVEYVVISPISCGRDWDFAEANVSRKSSFLFNCQ